MAGRGPDGNEGWYPATKGDALFVRLHATVGFYSGTQSGVHDLVLAMRSPFPFQRPPLVAREAGILRLTSEGLSNPQIGDLLVVLAHGSLNSDASVGGVRRPHYLLRRAYRRAGRFNPGSGEMPARSDAGMGIVS